MKGFTSEGKIAIKDFREIYDTAYASKLILIPVPVQQVIDYTLLDEVLKERK